MDSSSLIVYPQAANQTIFTRKATKVDEGRYTCVLRNDTHTMEHQMMLKVLGKLKEENSSLFSPSYRLTFPGRFFNYSGFSSFLLVGITFENLNLISHFHHSQILRQMFHWPHFPRETSSLTSAEVLGFSVNRLWAKKICLTCPSTSDGSMCWTTTSSIQ